MSNNKTLKLVLTCGAPASGKTTWAKQQVEANPEKIARVSRDDFRHMLSGYHFSTENESLVNSLRDFAIKKALLSGYDVIVDETHTDKKSFDRAIAMVEKLKINCEVSEKIFYEELDVLLDRNSKRIGKTCIPENIVISMFDKLGKDKLKLRQPKTQLIGNYKDYTEVSLKINDEALPKSILIDLDGTLSLFNDKSNRYPFAKFRNPYSAELSNLDSPNKQIVKLIELFSKDDVHIVFCSGREDKFKPQTLEFLSKHIDPNICYDLYMRKSGDFRVDWVVKEELLINNIVGKYNIYFALDDRSSVVEHYRKMGINVWQVADGNF